MACSAALFGATFGAADFTGAACVAVAFAGLVFAAGVDLAADSAEVGFLAAGFLADGVAFALGALDTAGIAGLGIDEVESSELFVAIRIL
ncbi:hypothetical protein GCM10009655_03610 [Rhodoglobus aureus]|uniref:Uncharacterized protein n=1 Tax=Rhodoglobus aureus TaxID=191497 RepID=A0ABN1VEI4_9MICO